MSAEPFDNSNLVATHAACGCQRVEHRPISNADGTLSDAWFCTECDQEFISMLRHKVNKMWRTTEPGSETNESGEDEEPK